MENFLQIVLKNIKLTDDMYETIHQYLKVKQLPSGAHLFKPGQVFSYIFFVETGAVYSYEIDEQGRENVRNFTFENQFIADFVSYNLNTPSTLYLKTLEPSTFYFVEKKDLDGLLEKDLRWERLMRKLLQVALVEAINDRNDLRTLSNEAHYLKLINTYPYMLQRVPLYLIASYLNITPEGLSKIRSRVNKKKL